MADLTKPCLSLYFGEVKPDAESPFAVNQYTGTPADAYTCERCGSTFSERHPTTMLSGDGPCASYYREREGG